MESLTEEEAVASMKRKGKGKVDKTPEEVGDMLGAPEEPEEESALDEFKRKHRGAKKNWVLPEHFPSDRVVQAYVQPQVRLPG